MDKQRYFWIAIYSSLVRRIKRKKEEKTESWSELSIIQQAKQIVNENAKYDAFPIVLVGIFFFKHLSGISSDDFCMR